MSLLCETKSPFRLGYKSRNHRIENCINKLARKQTELANRVFFGNVAYETDANLHFDFYRQQLNQTIRKQIEPILNLIFDRCADKWKQKECYSQYFLPYMLRQRIMGNDSQISIIQLHATTLPEIKNVAKPKYTFINLVLFYGSAISLWFGLTIIRLFYSLIDVYYSSKTKFNSIRTAIKTRRIKNKLIMIHKNRIRNRRSIGNLNVEIASSRKQSVIDMPSSPVDLASSSNETVQIAILSKKLQFPTNSRRASCIAKHEIINIPHTIT